LNLSKRERVIRTLELDDKIDMLPVHYLGFEKSGKAYQDFLKTNEYLENKTFIKNDFSKTRYCWAGDITDLRFLNVDCQAIDPWGPKKFNPKTKKGPPEFPESMITAIDGRLYFKLKVKPINITLIKIN
jgi:hypothetical protein